MAGTTAPVTFAGAIVITNAEQLATLVILKCADPAAPMVYSSDTGAADMRTGGMNYASTDRPALSAAMAQMAAYYGFPSCVSHDSCEDKNYAFKEGFEKNVLHIAINIMTRSDLAVWMGSLDEALGASLWDLVLDAEALKLAKEYNKWREVSGDTLAVDIINKIGPGGHFFGCAHTVKNFRNEVSLYDYGKNFIFSGDGANFVEKAKNRVREILKSHQPVKIADEKLLAMDEVIAEARRVL